MDFYQNFVRLCNEVGISPSAAIVRVGLKKSAVTRWKKGGNPTDATIEKICKEFGVTSDYFSEKKEAPADDGERKYSEATKEVIDFMENHPELSEELLSYVRFKTASLGGK